MMVILPNHKDSELMFPFEIQGKNFFIDIEVVDAQLEYNILLGRNSIYTMKFGTYTMFHLMMFPHNGKVVMLDQINYHDPKLTVNPDNALPVIGGSLSMTSFS